MDAPRVAYLYLWGRLHGARQRYHAAMVRTPAAQTWFLMLRVAYGLSVELNTACGRNKAVSQLLLLITLCERCLCAQPMIVSTPQTLH